MQRNTQSYTLIDLYKSVAKWAIVGTGLGIGCICHSYSTNSELDRIQRPPPSLSERTSASGPFRPGAALQCLPEFKR